MSAPTLRELLLLILTLYSLAHFYSFASHPSGHSIDAFSSSTNHHTPQKQLVEPRPLDTRLSWESSESIPQTQTISHTPGWTMLDKLYLLRGVVYVVTDNPSKVPDPFIMYHKGTKLVPDPEAPKNRYPTDKDMRIINSVQVINGMTFLINDDCQFLTHYYHWTAEFVLGLWRAYTSLDRFTTYNGSTSLPPPHHLNQFVLRTAFPSLIMEFSDDWHDHSEMGIPFVFERVLIADRSASELAYNFERFLRTASVAFGLPGSSTVNWWRTIRNNVVRFTGLDPLNAKIPEDATDTPVITYASRQEWNKRMLKPEDHELLVKELYKLRDEHGYEVNIVSMDKITRQEQTRLSGRTTIMMGIHGNALTSFVWMNPTPRSAVMEFFFPEGFAYDYEFTARAIGLKHYGFWGDRFFTAPHLPKVNYPEGFQGKSIPLNGTLVEELVHEILSQATELDDKAIQF
ncbi:hypothetical protein L218DRAFT_978133 [Marasmius fiardii PR-910]|nr:hypothetical protein L218DRAFT_978133 [Marasmius fiardii PR-910]